jgi:hypothetical protein
MERLSGVVGPLNERPIIQIKWLASVNHASTLFLLAASNKSKFGLLGREQGNRVWVLGETASLFVRAKTRQTQFSAYEIYRGKPVGRPAGKGMWN